MVPPSDTQSTLPKKHYGFRPKEVSCADSKGYGTEIAGPPRARVTRETEISFRETSPVCPRTSITPSSPFKAAKLEVQKITGANRDAPTLVFLHEGLGSARCGRFPRRAPAAGCAAVVYSRYWLRPSEPLGGRTARITCTARPSRCFPSCSREARVPIRSVGHSDGGSMR